MIPTPAGAAATPSSAPRICGDDPWRDVHPDTDSTVLPAHAGMVPALGRDVDLITSLRGLESYFMDELERDTVRIYER